MYYAQRNKIQELRAAKTNMKYNWVTKPSINMTPRFKQSSTNSGLESHSDKEVSDVSDKNIRKFLAL